MDLTTEEVHRYLESQGAEDTVTIDVNGDLAEIKKMVIASGRSVRHIRKMAESIVAAVSAAMSRSTWYLYLRGRHR